MLSQAAFNAFLKTLEEPPAYAKFILATTEKHKIIPTILSRCQIFDFKRITVDDIFKHLQNIAMKEGINAEEEALNIIAQKADGALRDSLSIFDQMVSFSGKNMTYKDVINNLNVLDYEYYFQMVDNILNKDNNSILLLLNKVVESGFDIQHFIQGLASHLRNLLLGKDIRLIDLMEVSRQLKSRYAEQAQKCSQYFLLKTLDLANQCDLNFRNSNNKRLHLEICLMKMCYVEASSPRVAETTSQQVNKTTSQQVVESPSHQVTKSQSQRVVETQSQTQSQQTQSQSQTQTQTQSQTPTVRAGRLSRPSTISITEDEPKKEEIVEEVWNDTIDQERLTKVWDEFANAIQSSSPSFSVSIKNAEPQLVNGIEIHYKVDNMLVTKDQNNMQALREYLKAKLHNNQFVLKEEIIERARETVLYTDKQKFEKMATDNPNIVNIKQSLNLQLDI